MKLTVILLLACTLQVTARSFGQTVTLNVKDQPIEKVFSEIERQTGYTFFYRQELVDKVRTVTVNVKGASISETLNQCLKGVSFTYKIINKTISIDISIPKNAQIDENNLLLPIDIHGKVTDEKGDPVEGVSVTIKGTKNATSTNSTGEFVLKSVDKDAVLVFTSVNMEAFELKVNNRTELTINLKTKISALGNVSVTVSTGYQQISRERMVGSFSQLDSTAYNRKAGVGIIDRLDGTIPGLLFDYKTNSADFSRVKIRGVSSLGGVGGTQTSLLRPLIILDNFPYNGDFGTINQNDIESITVLKDAAATSIWGARAGNGVIIVSTKKGKFNQPLSINVSSLVTVQGKPDLYYFPQMNTSDFINVETYLFNNGYFNGNLSDPNHPAVSPIVETLSRRKAGLITPSDSASQIDALRELDVRNDLNKYVYRRSVSQQHHIELSGGNTNINYQFAVGYNRTVNNIQNSKPDDQLTISNTICYRPIGNLEIQTGANYTYGTQKSINFTLPSTPYPYATLADNSGNSQPFPYSIRMGYIDTAGSGKLLDWHYRPLDEIRNADNTTVTQFIRLNVATIYKIAPFLSAEVRYQFSEQPQFTRNFYSLNTYYTRNLINSYTNLNQSNPSLRNPVPVGGVLNLFNQDSRSHNIRGQLNFNKSWKGNLHSLNAMVVAEKSEEKGTTFSNTFYGYNDAIGSYSTGVDYLNLYPLYIYSSARVPNGSAYSESLINRYISVLSNASYSYKGIYTVYGSARRDGSNIFGVNTDNKWKPLWSVGGSWKLSGEKFYSISWANNLKLRLSYGYSGNVNNSLSGLSTIVYVNSPAPLTALPTAQIQNPPNPDLRWESVRIENLGIDFGFLNNRLTGSFDYFKKQSTDLISQIPFAPASGVNLFTVNAASLKGNGFDLVLNSRNLVGPFQWHSSFSLSYSKMKVIKFYNGGFKAQDYIGYSLNPGVGRVVNSIAAYKWAGLDPVTGDPQGILNKAVSKNYSGIFSDSVDNQVFVGSAVPLYFGFLNNSFSWKNISLSFNMTFRFNYYFRKPALSYSSLFSSRQGNAEFAQRWQKPGDEKYTNVPSLSYPANSNRDLFYQYSEINVLKGDNLRLQDVRLQYILYKRNWQVLPFRQIQFFVYASNLNIILWRAQKSPWDPDFTGGVNGYAIPPSKAWTGGINITL